MSDILIGTSGYDYPEWKNVFYPPELKRKDFLSYYASQFNALEVNNTFYAMPTAARLLSLYERSEGKLQFSIKANRLLTHEIGALWQNEAEAFRTAVRPLLENSVLCSVLFQFPQSFHYTADNRFYLAKLLADFSEFPVSVEFRHKEWIRPSVFEGLDKRGASLVFCDMPQLKYLPAAEVSEKGISAVAPFIGPVAYIRLHGRNADAWYVNDSGNSGGPENSGSSGNGSARYTYDYSDDELWQFVPVIKSAVLTGKRPVVFFNNHPNGSGALNAKKLGAMLATEQRSRAGRYLSSECPEAQKVSEQLRTQSPSL